MSKPHLVHLRRDQTKITPVVEEILFDFKITSDQDELKKRLIEGHLSGCQKSTDMLVEGHGFLCALVVGRYLYNWPSTQRFEEDMMGEAYLALCQTIQGIDNVERWEWLVNDIILSVRSSIETYINDNQTLVRSSLRTNFRRLKDGEPLEYSTHRNLGVNDGFYYDPGYGLVAFKFAMDHLRQYDKEEVFDVAVTELERVKGPITNRELKLLNLVIQQLKGII